VNIRQTYLDNEFRQIFRNLGNPERTSKLQPETWVKYAKKCGATTMFMDFRSQFYANHESEFIPKDPVLGGRDLCREFADACRKHGMKCCAYIPPCTIESLEHGHDDWQQRTPDGQKEARNWGFWRTIFCYNTGFRNLFAGHLAEVARKYKVHGFYIDGVIYGFGACYCETCKAKFRQETGQEMPTEPKWDSPLWHTYIQWRYRQVAEIGKLIGEAVHKVDPKIAVIWNCTYYNTGWYAGASPAQAAWLDFAGVERLPTGHWGGYPGFTYTEELAWDISLNRALRFGQWSQHYSYFPPVMRRAEIFLTANAAAAFGAQGCPQERCNHMADYYARIQQAEPWMIDSVSANDVALHYSVLAQNAFYQPSNHGEINKAMGDVRGLYKALLNSHLPAEVVNDEWLEQEPLGGFRTVILPNSVCLTPKATAALQEYVQAGGTLIATMETGLRDSQGHRTGDELLWKGSGLKFVGDIQTLGVKVADWFPDKPPVIETDVSANPDQFLMFGAKAAMKKWIGEDITPRPSGDISERREVHQFAETPSVHLSARAVEVEADRQWKTILPMRYRRDKAEGFLTTPAVLTRKCGKGRIVYVNFQLGEQAAGMTTLTGTVAAHPWWQCFVGQLVRAAAGTPKVAVEAPVCIKTALWKQPALNRYALHLVNELSTTGVRAVQHVDFVPVPAKVTILLPGVMKVKVVVGGKVAGTPRLDAKVSRKGKAWTVTFPAIEERAVIECSC
jgi:hypothetical protein